MPPLPTQDLPTPVEIQTKEELLTALETAGIEVLETAMLPKPLYGAAGQIYQVGKALIMVYEAESLEAREEISNRLISGDLAGAEWFSLSSEPPSVWAVGKLIVIYPGNDGGIILTIGALMGDPILGIESASDEPFPPAISASILWLSESLDVDPNDIKVLEYEAREWPDSCLGLAEPEQDCAQVITPGWRIVLQAGDMGYVIRADEVGSALRLETES